jgi:tetratricopeptide (TPR) repeat protein
VWQQLYQTHKDSGIEILSVAMDAQGAAKALPYVEKAGATFTTVVDGDNLLGQFLNARAIPNGVLIDEQGVVRHINLGGFDVHHAETKRLVEDWFRQPSGAVDAPAVTDETPLDERALKLFERGLTLYRDGNTSEATAEWRKAIEFDPKNWIIRKQLWAVEHPDKFYAGDVDYGWQREQIEKGM